MSICLKSIPLIISINIYGFVSISDIASIPRVLYTFFALSTPIPNLSRKPTICHTSQFSIKLLEISIAFSLVIPFICANLCGSNFNICMVSSPNLSTILLAVTGPTPFIFPFAKYASNASVVCGINFQMFLL